MTNEQNGSASAPLGSPQRLEMVEHGLAGVDPRSLDALMAEDVGKLTEEEFLRVIAELRKARATWQTNEAAREAKPRGAAAGPKPAKAPKGAKGTVDINLGELFGEE